MIAPAPDLPAGRPIRAWEAAGTLPGFEDPETFHAGWGREPLILRSLLGADHPLRRLGLEGLERLLGEEPLRAYPRGSEEAVAVPARAVLADVLSGAGRYNVVDHGLAGTPLGQWVAAPAFLGGNWFAGPPFGLDRYVASLVISPEGAFTPLHHDSYAMQGWMVLLEGRKRWRLHPPEEREALFDREHREFFDPRRHDPRRFPDLARGRPVEGTIGPGDFLYFPAGWVHQVETLAPSFGVGGCVINEHQIEAHVRGWLWERRRGVAGDLDLAAALAALTPDRFTTPAGRRRTQAAVASAQEPPTP